MGSNSVLVQIGFTRVLGVPSLQQNAQHSKLKRQVITSVRCSEGFSF